MCRSARVLPFVIIIWITVSATIPTKQYKFCFGATGTTSAEKSDPWRYEIVEEDHHFQKEGEKYYRISKIYRNTIEKATGNILKKELILDNHSKVMYDPELIPKELIRS